MKSYDNSVSKFCVVIARKSEPSQSVRPSRTWIFPCSIFPSAPFKSTQIVAVVDIDFTRDCWLCPGQLVALLQSMARTRHQARPLSSPAHIHHTGLGPGFDIKEDRLGFKNIQL